MFKRRGGNVYRILPDLVLAFHGCDEETYSLIALEEYFWKENRYMKDRG